MAARKKKSRKAKKRKGGARRKRTTPKLSSATLAKYRAQKNTLKKGMYSGKRYRLVEA